MPRPRRRLRRRTYRLRRRWHRLARPLRRPARVIVALAVLTVAGFGFYGQAQLPLMSSARAPVQPGPDSTAVVGELTRGDYALAGVREGDRLLAVDGDTVSARQAASMRRLYAYRALGETTPVRVERDGDVLAFDVVIGRQERADARRFGLSQAAVEWVERGLMLLALAAFITVGAFLFVRSRARGYHAQLGIALVAVTGVFGFGPMQRTNLVAILGPFAIAVVVFTLIVAISAIPMVTSALVRFPDGRVGPRWTFRMRRYAAIGIGVAFGLVVVTDLLDLPEWVRDGLGAAVLIGVVALPAVGLVQKYRQTSDAVVRQQMKWVVLPLSVFVVGLCVPALAEVVPAFDAEQRATGYLFQLVVNVALNLGLAVVPLGVLAGTLNFRPWDADLWIARSAAVGAATLGLAAAFAGGAEMLRLGLRSSMGDGAEAVAAALAAVVALVVFNPVREWLTRRADASLYRTRERLTERLPLLLAGRQVVASPEEIGRVAIAAVQEALATDRAAVLDLDPDGWEAVATHGVDPADVLDWARATLDPRTTPPGSVQVWGDPLFVLRVPLRSAEDELVGVLALGTHGKGRGYSTEERKALDVASRSLAEALRVAERRQEAEAHLADRLAALVDRVAGPASGDGSETEPAL